MKIVINKSYGGFFLSETAVRAYAKRKGVGELYVERIGSIGAIYWTVPPEQWLKSPRGEQWRAMNKDEREAYNDAYTSRTLDISEIRRDDPDLVAVVEELGKGASTDLSNLVVVEVPDGVVWEIDEYDGYEEVAEVHRTWG